MSPEPHYDAEQRDKALARLMQHDQAAKDRGVAETPCPDAEVLAAFADQGLDVQEMARCEGHIASCSRCRKALALIAMAADASLETASDARPQTAKDAVVSAAVPTAAVPASSQRPDVAPGAAVSAPIQIIPRRRPWLIPALSAAAVVAMWFALRPAWLNEPAQTIAQYPAATDSANQETQIAQADLPRQPVPPLASAQTPLENRSTTETVQGVDAVERKQKTEPVPAQTAPPTRTVASPPATAESTDTLIAAQNQSRNVPPDAAAEPSRARDSSAAVSGAAAGGGIAPAPGEPAPASSAATSARSASRPDAATPAAPPEAADASREAQQKVAEDSRRVPFSARSEVATLARVSQPTVFTTPDQAVRWRVGAGGKIERSADQGRTWQVQTSGATADLAAGAAPSASVAWVVGRGGVLLRTTDGNSWHRVAAPAGASLDWAGVTATDALHAVIVSQDGQRFRTEDGGRTWTKQ